MSKFLAPIHTWLFNKIKLYESLETDIINNFNSSDANIKDILDDIDKNFQSPLDDRPIEDIIDVTNIHGWLQNRIRVAETRQAYLITKIIDRFDNRGFSIIEECYVNQGKIAGKDASEKYPVSTPQDLFTALNNYILEGMPCDNANSISRNEEDIVEWRTVADLHKDYWEAVDGNSEVFYELRKAWISSFIETANPKYKYSFEVKYLNEVKEYLSNITKK
ncbi:MAG: hypothetical protein VB130_04305 [Clostridium sp.]|nr:hypothetical protein [Clostridium sp.]